MINSINNRTGFLELHRSWWLGTYNSTYTLTLPCNSEILSALADYILHHLLPAEALNGGALVNMKGRDQTGGDELCFISGSVTADSADGQSQSFEIRIRSEFEQFRGASEILHRTRIVKAGLVLPDSIPLKDYAQLIPVTLNELRIGFDLFSGRRIILIGSIPTVTQQLTIDATAKGFVLRISAERLKTKETLPLERDGLFEKLNTMLNEIFRFDLKTDYFSGL